MHASHFGWDATAAATLDVYRDALADRAGAGARTASQA
jgi:hypothetical protein